MNNASCFSENSRSGAVSGISRSHVRNKTSVMVLSGFIAILLAMLVIPRTGLAQDVECHSRWAEPTTPSSRFTILADGSSVRDTATGLEWQRCPFGAMWTGSGCSGRGETLTIDRAQILVERLGDGWRLPNSLELQTIVERCRIRPAINQVIFPLGRRAGYFMSGSLNRMRPEIWTVDFSYGELSSRSPRSSYYVRLVRGAQYGSSDTSQEGLCVANVRPSGHAGGRFDYTLSESRQTVTHTLTGLEWQRCAFGAFWNGQTCVGSPVSLRWNQIEQLKSKLTDGWRLPEIDELITIVESCRTPASISGSYPWPPMLNPDAFPNPPTEPRIWSSTDNWRGDRKLCVSGSSGGTTTCSSHEQFVFLVRRKATSR